MIFLDKFILPIEEEDSIMQAKIDENGSYLDNRYPCDIFSHKFFYQVDFAKVTIFYGGNGSGKSTLLNLITNKLGLIRISPYNSSELFDKYVEKCFAETGYDDFGEKCEIPEQSRMISSDDIFDYMLNVRVNNTDIAQSREEAKEDRNRRKYGETVKLKSMADYEDLRLQVLARRKSISKRKFVNMFAGEELKLNSNGETAIRYFNENLEFDKLYLLDEPENSLSPEKQIELVSIIEEYAKYCGCQFVIATHSPFVLSIEGAKIYDLDANPVDVKKWWELSNTKTYFKFFNKHKDLFLK